MSYISVNNSKKLSGIKSFSLRIGFEPMREKPIGFRVQLLNHSDTAAYINLSLNLIFRYNY